MSDENRPPTGEVRPDRPVLRVVRGVPDAMELAALVTVLSARASAAGPDPTTQTTSTWADRARALRAPAPHGPGAWTASARP